MKIRSVRAVSRTLALKKPYTIARETFHDTENVFFEVELADGTRGLGAANPDPAVVGETPADTLANLQSDAVTQLEGKDIRHFLGHIREFQARFAAYPGTQAAIDIALHDAFCRHLGVSVLDFYGRHHDRMITSVTIGIKGVAETLEEAREYHALGFRALKVKTGLDADLDAERVIRLRETYGSHFLIRTDANTGYDFPQLTHFLERTQGLGLELVEQPFLPAMDAELLKLPPPVRRQIAADESLKTARSALNLSRDSPFGIFVIKLMKCGGIAAAFDIASIARHAGIELFWGCNDESMVSITAALHAAFACPETRYLDLDGSLDLAEDLVTNGFTITDGYMYPSDLPGLGFETLSQ